MDIGYKLKTENPTKSVNCITKLFFGWMYQTVRKGAKGCLELKDLYAVLENDKSEKLANKLEKNWKDELNKVRSENETPSFLKAIQKTFRFEFMLYGLLWFLVNVCIRCSQPVILAKLISCFSETYNGTDKQLDKNIYGILLVGVTGCGMFITHHTSFGLAIIGMRIRIAASSLVYRKIIKLNQKSLGQTTAGQIVNLLANDVNRFDLVTIPLHTIWVLPFQISLLSWFIWTEVGISAVAGIVTVISFSVPLQVCLGKYIGKFRSSISKKSDSRVKLMNEIISGIQVIKMYAWEKPFEKIVQLARENEIEDITSASYLRGIFASCMVFLDRTALAVTVICYVLLGNNITSGIVFSLAQSYNILQNATAIWFPMAISQGAEAWISVKRLQEFLLLEEKEQSKIEKLKKKAVILSSVNASWEESTTTLKDISLTILPGTLCAIVGPVGAGKSSLLQLLLGELPSKSGKTQIGGEISYCSQEPWLFQSTVRNNILFGRKYEKYFYEKVVKVCALERDFEQFPLGDKTIVGERGVSLSGGQRARINLARAVYRQADIYLFDDPLSAVDTHVGKQLFEDCINRHLKGRIRILVTHQLQYLKQANLIIVINKGTIEAQGTFEQLSNSKLDFTKLLVAADETHEKQEQEPGLSEFMLTISSRRTSSISLDSKADTIEYIQEPLDIEEEDSGKDGNHQAFKKYLLATNNICLLCLLIMLMILAQSICTGADLWVAFWTIEEEIRHFKNNSTLINATLGPPVTATVEIFRLEDSINPQDTHIYTYEVQKNTSVFTPPSDGIFDDITIDNEHYKIIKTYYAMYFYGGLIVGAILLTTGRSFLYFKMCMMSSKNLHSKMFHSLLKAPMRFFDTNPSGRILNRFSKDIGAIDEILPRVLLTVLQVLLVMTGILINVAITNHYIVIAIVILGAICIKLKGWYMLTAKALKHLEGITKSPVFSHVNSTLNGIVTIRASNAQNILSVEFDNHQDIHTSAWYLILSCMFSFGLWLDLVCLVFAATVIFSFVLLFNLFNVSGSLVGLAISQSMVLTGMLQSGMRELAEVINQLTSIERVLQYTTIDQEGPFETPKENLPKSPWPSKGRIEFKNLVLKYIEDDPPVLNNLNFLVKSGQKIGIVGRTGAGKSSLINALFRLAPLEGYIFIDDVDTQTLGLNELRRSISIIPQEPVLFSATVRYNLDPFDEFEDDQIWKALEQVELKDSIDSLDFIVAGGGANFSLGERQLVCLARAALRNNKILIMDEATANVDLRTDSFIQTTIRKRFKECTVLTIAHRLNTIMDSDKVLVMNFGQMVEFDHPHKLLQIPGGHLNKLVMETGPTMSLQLKDIAMAAFKNYEDAH
ncbi:unnamed protein product [Psylliodes chrysocephalus]|uniref:Uncharacterized protein n=1 Tax=Psylliodes chrysocephalus TaxID=3402493 RepID=A0A9P0CU97_9CUCU|nr:unnamed protein product [Psylliodes chrysocephala]